MNEEYIEVDEILVEKYSIYINDDDLINKESLLKYIATLIPDELERCNRFDLEINNTYKHSDTSVSFYLCHKRTENTYEHAARMAKEKAKHTTKMAKLLALADELDFNLSKKQ